LCLLSEAFLDREGAGIGDSSGQNVPFFGKSLFRKVTLFMPNMEEPKVNTAASATFLIRRILAGENDLFHNLIRPHERSFFLRAYAILRNQEDAEETVQQAMMKIYSNLAQLTETNKFKQWAMRVVENEAKMCRRKRRQYLYESIDPDSTEDSEERPFRPKQFADWRDLPSEEIEKSEVRAAVAEALAELPNIYREVFVLRDMQHLSVAETMEVLGVGESAVKIRLHRARLMLRESLTPFFAQPGSSFWARWKGVNPWLAARR
jgi:RNA polymerase sigma-70 factor (ECF subfamily)